MRKLIIVFIISLAFVSVGLSQRIIEDQPPGLITLDLGWGYTISFKLPQSEGNYDIEINKTITLGDLSGYGTIIEHEVYIKIADTDKKLARIDLGIPIISPDRFYLAAEVPNHKPEDSENRLHLLRSIVNTIRVSGPGI
jgi:hypothetical protein